MTQSAAKLKPASRAAALTPERIVSVAFDLINQHGIDALTMRAVGQQLNCHHTAVFWHFKTRADLISAVIGVAMEEMGAVLPGEGAWDERARGICRGIRRYLIEHPAIFGLGGSYQALGVAPFVRALIKAAEEAGYKGEEAIAAGRMLLDLVGGFAASEGSARDIDQAQLTAELLGSGGSADDVGLMLAYARVDHEAVFEAALEALLQAMRLRAPILEG